MTLTLADLLTARTADDVLDVLLARLQARGFQVTDWEPGGVQLTEFRAVCEMQAEKESQVVPALAGSQFLDLATGDWLTFVAKNRYNIDRLSATHAQQRISMSCVQGAGPYTIEPGTMRVESATGGLGFENVDGGDLTSTTPLVLTFRAESPGSSHNCPHGTVTKLITSLPGVSVNNPNRAYSSVTRRGYGSGTVTPASTGDPGARTFYVKIVTSGQVGAATFQWKTDAESDYSAATAVVASYAISAHDTTLAFANGSSSPSFVAGDVYVFVSPGSPLLVAGVDEESDASLRQRCRDTYPAMSANLTDGKLRLWARNASLEVTRSVPSAIGDGTVTLTVAGPDGAVSATAVLDVQSYVDARIEATDSVTVQSATAQDVSVSGTVEISSALLSSAQTAVDNGWRAYVQSVDIAGTVRLARLQQLLMDAGARDVSNLRLNGAASNLTIAAAYVARVANVPSAGLTWTIV